MKKVLATTLFAMLVVLPASASAFTIRFSAIRKLFAPQLSTTALTAAGIQTDDFLVTSSNVDTVLSGSSVGTTSISDVVYNYFTTGSVEKTCYVSVQDSGVTPTFISATPSIGTIASNGSTTYVTAGTAYFNARIGRRTKAIPCAFSRTSNTASYTYNSLVSTSTLKNMNDQVFAKANGITPSSTTYNLYSATNDGTQTYTRNSSLFTNSIDFTCIPVYSATTGTQVMGVLVAPDIMIQAVHSHSSGTIYFVKNDNTTVSRTITTGTTILGTDIYVAKLSSDVPAGITPCKVLPATAFGHSISTTALGYNRPPVVFTDQLRRLAVGLIGNNSNSSTMFEIPIIKDTSTYLSWYAPVVGGDSGSPAFALINGQAVLLGVWHTSNMSSWSSVPNLSNYITQINAAMASLGSAYTLTTASLSGFTSF